VVSPLQLPKRGFCTASCRARSLTISMCSDGLEVHGKAGDDLEE